MNERLFVLALVLAWSIAAGVDAAPPDVTSLFPAGGKRGTSVSVTMQGNLGTGAARAWCSRPGVTVSFPEKPGPLTINVAANVEPGVCWLRFFNDEGASGLRPFVIGACPEIIEVEPNDDVAKAQPLSSLPVVVNGQHVKSGDADSFTVPLKRGQVLVASMLANRVLGSPQDAVLQILGPDGFVLKQNEDDQGFDPQLAFTAPDEGIYTLRTWAFPATPDSSIRLFGSPACVYRLTVTTGPFVDHVGPPALQAGVASRVHLRGWNVPQDEINLTPPVSAIHQRFAFTLNEWSHRLPASVLVQPYPTTVEHEPNELSSPQSVSWPTSVTGHISQPRDVDTFQFLAKKGQRLRFEVVARDMGSPLDAVLRVYDSSGKVLREADDDGKQSTDPDVEFVAPTDGEYRVAVTDRFLHHGERFAYVLTVTEPLPDYSLSVAADAFVMNSGKELEIPVTITRLAGFADEILVEADGLPVRVTAEPVKSEPKGDSAKLVKLKFKADVEASASSGLLRIVGRSAGTIRNDRIATTSLKSFNADTAQLWLTVVPARK